MKKIEVVGALCMKAEGILICQRPAGATHGGLWEFPGGKVEAGELDEKALARELQEELALEVSVGRHLYTVKHRYPTFDIVLRLYHCRPLGDFKLLEAKDGFYVSQNKLGDYSMTPADVPVQRRLATQGWQSLCDGEDGGEALVIFSA